MKIPCLATLLSLALAIVSVAQDPAPGAPPAPTSAPAVPPKTITKEQTVFVPFDKLEEVFESKDRGIFMPYREFLEMWNKLNLPEKLKKKDAPVEGVLAAANYSGKVTGEVAEIKAKLSFEALKEGWSKLPLGAGELSIAESKSTAVLNYADGGYEMIFPNKGSYSMEATIFGRVARESGKNVLRLKLPRTSVSQFELTLPDKGLEFAVTPASAFSATENADGTTRLIVYFGASQDVEISWTKKVGETALQALLFADAQTTVRIGAGVVRSDVVLTYQVLRTGVKAFEVVLPADQQVLSVGGQDLKEWTLKAEQGTQRLHVDLYTAAKESYVLNLRLEAALAALPQQVKLPLVQAQSVERQSGSITVVADAEIVAEMGALQGLTQQAAAVDTPDSPARDSGVVGSYRYLRLPYAGTVAVSEAKPQIEVSSETVLKITPETRELSATFGYSVKKAGIFGTQIELPAGLEKVEVTGDNVETFTVQKEGARNLLNVKFSSRQLEYTAFTVKAEAPREKPDEAVTVPVFIPQNVERHEAKVGLAIHVSLKANTVDKGDLREEDIRNLGKLPDEMRGENIPLTLGFRYRGAAKPAQVQFELRKPRISAEVRALVEIRETSLRHTWTIGYNIEYAGVNELAIEVPKAIADDLQIDGANIKERIKSDATDAQGQPTGATQWRVILQDKALGAYELTLSHDEARAEQKPGSVAQVTLTEIKPLNLFRENGQIAVMKDGNLEFTKTTPKGLEVIDPKELHGTLERDGVVLAYKYSAHPIGLTLDVSKNFYLDVPTAVVSYAVLTSVIAEDEAETTEVVYWVRNNAQQFFSVQLPSKAGQAAKLLSDAFVNGEPQQPSKRPDKNEVLIRLPARQDNNELFPVRFVYEVPSPNPGKRMGWRGHFEIQPPKLGDTEVLQTRWTLYLPSDYRYVGFEGSMRESVSRRGWDRLFHAFRLFVPRVGPALIVPDGPARNEPPALPPVKSAGFDTQIQKEGASVTLRRLDAPSNIDVGYRAKTYAATVEAVACLLAFVIGIRLKSASRQTRFSYFAIVGLGALVVAGAVNPRVAGLWQSIYLGVFFALLVWLICGAWKTLCRIWGHIREFSRSKPQPKATPRPVPKDPPPVPPTTGGPAGTTPLTP